MEAKRYDNINGLRAFGCLAITAWHVLHNGKYSGYGYLSDSIIPAFNYLVYLFMIISGFGMCNGYYQRLKSGDYDLNKFYSRRYQKVVPFFALLILLNVIMEFNWQTIFEGLMEVTMLFGFLPNNTLNVIGVAWTLGAIFAFYIIFPFVVFLLYDKRRAFLSFVASLGITFMCQMYFMTEKFVTEDFTMRHSFLFCLPYFLCGGLIYLFENEIFNIVNKYKILSFVSCVILIIGYFIVPDKITGVDVIIPKTLLLYSVCLCASLGKRTPLLSNKFTDYISGISMEIYLSHMVAFRIVEKLHIPQLFGKTFCGYLLTYVSVVALVIMGIVVYRKAAILITSKILRKA